MNKDKTTTLPPPKKALGKGIHSLLGETTGAASTEVETKVPPAPARPAAVAAATPESSAAQSKFQLIPITKIRPNPRQPRKTFAEKELAELAESLKRDGILQPLTVMRDQDRTGNFILVAGERRFRAAQLAGLAQVPVSISADLSEQELLRIALVENIQRAELNPMEEAEAYHALINEFKLTQEECAKQVGKDRATVANTLRLLALPTEIRQDIADGRLTMGHGRALLSLNEKKLMLRARDVVVKKNLSVRQTEQFTKSFQARSAEDRAGGASGGSSADEGDLAFIVESLRSSLKTRVRVVGDGQRGKIEISYFSAVELERLVSLLTPRTS